MKATTLMVCLSAGLTAVLLACAPGYSPPQAYLALRVPPDATDPPPAPRQFPGFRRAVLEAVIDLELDDRTGWWLRGPDEYAADMKTFRTRLREAADFPPAADVYRFPPREAVAAVRAANRAYRAHLAARLELETDREPQLRLALREAEAMYRAWDHLDTASGPWGGVYYRRAALAAFRDEIGRDAYARGECPPAFPFWRLEDR